MLPTSTRPLIFTLLFAVALIGCKKDEAKDAPDKAAAGKTTEKTEDGKKSAEAPTGAIGGALGSDASALATRLPGNAALVMGISLDRARQTSAYKAYQGLISGEMDEPITDIRKACNLELMSIPGSLTVSMGGYEGPGKKDVTMLLETSWGRAKIESCLQAIGEMKDGKKIAIENDGKITRYRTPKEKKPLVVAWMSDTAVLMHTDFNSDKGVAGVANGTSLLKDNKILAPLLSTVDRGGVAWLVGTVPPDGKEKLSKLVANADPLGFYASLNYKDELSTVIGVRFADADSAERVATAAKGLLELSKARPEVKQFAPFMEKIELTSKGNDFIATGSLTAAQVQQLMAMASKEIGLPKPSK